ncbi:hypothetical protein BJ684DRAFT_18898 [Piptocephalis cylindrospora]|uniref:Uncharacterized protein n=1 Tax=Piptocephalis cylindrospora TaxID=1907219 RepID=A0A4P9Y6J0_9FUNG|nr:hypothetical protein BJ684DRAFT_18898 [Piptocephalis cylindrospora]|eukprot:RKP14716.1 hypothetical protein BJ684DRAFT_18898 [Piptocephalis cylindrospora]
MQPDTPPSVPISSSLAGPVRSGRQAPKMRSAGVQTEGSDEEVMSALLDPTGKKVDRVKERVLTSIRDIETLELALEREKTEGIRELAQLQTEVEGLREASQKVDNRSARRTEDRITALHGQVKALTTRRQVQEREMRRLREERLRLERKEAELRAQVERLKAQAKAKEAAETERRARVKAVRQREADRIEEEREEAEKRLEALSHEVSVLAKALDEGKFQEKIVELEDRRSKAYERRDEIQRERAELSASIQPRTEEEMAEAIRLLERRVDEKRRFAEGEIAFVERLWEEVQKADGGLMDGERPMDDEKSMEGEESMEDGGKDEAR